MRVNAAGCHCDSVAWTTDQLPAPFGKSGVLQTAVPAMLGSPPNVSHQTRCETTANSGPGHFLSGLTRLRLFIQTHAPTPAGRSFRLIVHTERREMPVYALTAARPDRKFGPGLRKSDATCAGEEAELLSRRRARVLRHAVTSGPAPAPCRRPVGSRCLVSHGYCLGAPVVPCSIVIPVSMRHTTWKSEWSSDLGLLQAPPGSAGAAELRHGGRHLAVHRAAGAARSSPSGHTRSS